jgi:hypothetical protein
LFTKLLSLHVLFVRDNDQGLVLLKCPILLIHSVSENPTWSASLRVVPGFASTPLLLKSVNDLCHDLPFLDVSLNRCTVVQSIGRFYLAKDTEMFILGRYFLLGILLILLSLRPPGVAARAAILENKGGKSLFCDYFIIRASPTKFRFLRISRDRFFSIQITSTSI